MSQYVFQLEKLEVYQPASDPAGFVFHLLAGLPEGKSLRVVSQMGAAVVSPPRKIAKGKGRQ